MLHSPPEYDDATMAGNTGHGPAVGHLVRDGDAQAEDVSEPRLEMAGEDTGQANNTPTPQTT